MQEPPVTAEAKPRHLNSWKEIAAYLGRGVRTVQRWEKMGLPVQRPKTGNRGFVTAATDDIDNWLLAAQTHGFNVPRGERQLFREGLLDSVQQARVLRKEMATLREDGQIAVTQLTDKITALGKTCGNTQSESNAKKLRVLGGGRKS